MSGNVNNGFELSPFHLVGKFSPTEAKSPLFASYVFHHFDCHLEGLATKFDVIAPTNFPACCFCSVTTFLVILELYKYSNNLPITVSAARTEVQGIVQEEWTTIPIAKNRRIKTNKPFQIGVWLCLFRSDFVADCFQVAYRPLLFGSRSWEKVLKDMTEFQRFCCTRKRFLPLEKADRREKIKERRKYAVSVNVSYFRNLSTIYFKSW